jgi:hypothetical protein
MKTCPRTATAGAGCGGWRGTALRWAPATPESVRGRTNAARMHAVNRMRRGMCIPFTRQLLSRSSFATAARNCRTSRVNVPCARACEPRRLPLNRGTARGTAASGGRSAQRRGDSVGGQLQRACDELDLATLHAAILSMLPNAGGHQLQRQVRYRDEQPAVLKCLTNRRS